MYIRPKANDETKTEHDTAPPCADGAGGEPRKGASGKAPSRVGRDACALVVDSRSGGHAALIIAGKIPRMTVFDGRVFLEDRRQKDELETPVFVANGIPFCEAKKIPRAQAALDPERKLLWGARCCWIAESATEYDTDRQQHGLPSGTRCNSGAHSRSAPRATASYRRVQERAKTGSCSRAPSSWARARTSRPLRSLRRPAGVRIAGGDS